MTQGSLLLSNATVISLDPAFESADSVAVQGDRIVHVGDSHSARASLNDRYQEVDLAGATLLPGFIDAHHHLMTLGFWLSQIDCSFPTVRTIGDLVQAVGAKILVTPPGEWVLGRGYDDNKLCERRHPNKSDLDVVSPEHPVMIRNVSGHMSVANSVALRLAGISRETPAPPGGHVQVGEDGEPTGLLQETAEDLLGVPFLPSERDKLREYLRVAGSAFVKAGVTSGQEAGIFGPAEFSVLQEAWAEHTLSLRTYMMIRSGFLEALENVGFYTGFGDDWLRVGALKVISDGSLIGRTAALCSPYEGGAGDGGVGLALLSQAELDSIVWRGHRAGWQLAIHAIGDRAIGMCLNAYSAALERAPRSNHRHRIEHCGILDRNTIRRLAKMRVIPVGQPPFIAEYGDGFLRALGRERCQLTYPRKSFLKAGVPVAGSSDSPVSTYQPLFGVQAAVTERTQDGAVFAPDEALTVEEALMLYTRHAAYAAFEEGVKGTISPGKYADFAVLGRDPWAVPAETIAEIPIVATFQGGELVYEAPMQKCR